MSPIAAPTSTSSPSRPTVFGLFDRPATPERDLEAQGSIHTSNNTITSPSPARTHASRSRRSSQDTVDPIDTFFGVSHTPSRSRSSLSLTPAGTRDSRHDEIRDSTAVEPEVLPSYEDSLAPPSYAAVSSQPTLAMYLFKFGFLFPLFWVAGAFILLSPLQAPEDWESGKPEMERQELLGSMRRTEMKWARRCLYALVLLSLLVVAIVVAVLMGLRA